ncbi:hypothetical protein N7457_008731 [Penicillium paradoxum]|uniref:uncharacterized protein n=1 Tax=Penicillium paradoxum TaxID=176176 RepID=UPI002546AAE4|nr:uncharacterized protein N7457_008731 [Penicillium paradoxum]KAJ5773835.1 hypothetical protein N7457_008731 [Penicillium paradoxum]
MAALAFPATWSSTITRSNRALLDGGDFSSAIILAYHLIGYSQNLDFGSLRPGPFRRSLSPLVLSLFAINYLIGIYFTIYSGSLLPDWIETDPRSLNPLYRNLIQGDSSIPERQIGRE